MEVKRFLYQASWDESVSQAGPHKKFRLVFDSHPSLEGKVRIGILEGDSWVFPVSTRTLTVPYGIFAELVINTARRMEE